MSIHPPASLDPMAGLIQRQKRGEPYGLFSVCSAHPFVLSTAMKQAHKNRSLVLIEATANQVNQFGGYTGLNPLQFRNWISRLQEQHHLNPQQVVLGGDHLGPTAWQREPAAQAMEKAIQMARDYVTAGFTKIHLDASMPLGGDPIEGPSVDTCAERTAILCYQAECAWKELPPNSPPLHYIIGTEVPPPGGEQGNLNHLAITTVTSARQTLESTQHAFLKAGLEEAWQRVIALVVQPGVEFGNTTIHPYQHEATQQLSRFISQMPRIVYEAHSTDYQTPEALRQMVTDHFAILKVGPALTFAFREAVFALENIERELFGNHQPHRLSHLEDVLEEEMINEPQDWVRYYYGSPTEQRILRRFSLSDRIRYYWGKPRIADAFNLLLRNLQEFEIPATLISQFMPVQYTNHLQQGLSLSPAALIEDKVCEALKPYQYACGLSLTQ